MDIAKYIGLFLIKNEYCYLPGIGNLEIRKKPAQYNRDTQEMSAPQHEILFRPSIGSIDDSFANFVATNERISIAHAANAIKDFCSRAKQDLAEGRDLQVPGVGRFTGTGASLQFFTDPSLQIQGKSIPFFKNNTRAEAQREKAISEIYQSTEFKEPKADEEIILQAPQVNWGKIIMLSAIVVVLIVAAIFIYNYTASDNTATPANNEAEAVSDEVVQQPAAPVSQDSSAQTATNTAPDANGLLNYKVILQQYPTQGQAEKRVNQLKSYGNNVELAAADSSTFYVVMPMATPAADTGRIVDSLKRVFNPSGNVRVMH
jgi:nucleoid DNA-binding protein